MHGSAEHRFWFYHFVKGFRLIQRRYCFYFTEDNSGKAGRGSLLQLLDLSEDINWPELEFLYRLNSKSKYYFRLNYVKLEDWMNFDAKIDKVFALLCNLNRYSDLLGPTCNLECVSVLETHQFTSFCDGLYLTCFTSYFTSTRHQKNHLKEMDYRRRMGTSRYPEEPPRGKKKKNSQKTFSGEANSSPNNDRPNT